LDELQFLWGLGLPVEEAECCDVFGLDEELLEMVPKPVLAVLFLYPITAKVSFNSQNMLVLLVPIFISTTCHFHICCF